MCSSVNSVDYIALPVERGEPESASATANRRRRSNTMGKEISATTASRRRNGRRRCSHSKGPSTTRRLSGRGSNPADAMSVEREKWSIIRGNAGEYPRRVLCKAGPGVERTGGAEGPDLEHWRVQ